MRSLGGASQQVWVLLTDYDVSVGTCGGGSGGDSGGVSATGPSTSCELEACAAVVTVRRLEPWRWPVEPQEAGGHDQGGHQGGHIGGNQEGGALFRLPSEVLLTTPWDLVGPVEVNGPELVRGAAKAGKQTTVRAWFFAT